MTDLDGEFMPEWDKIAKHLPLHSHAAIMAIRGEANFIAGFCKWLREGNEVLKEQAV